MYADRDPSRPHLEPFFSPSFTEADWDEARPVVAAKLDDLASRPAAGPWRLVVVGRLTPNKNQQAAVRALALVVAAGLDASLEVLGDGPEMERLVALAAELGVADRVAFRGMVDLREVTATFAASHIQLLTSKQEGFGKVLLEGMVQGVVPLLSHSRASGEISGHGSRGVVVDPEDPAAIARAVQALVADRERWARMVDDARNYTGAHTLEVFGQEVRAMLERQWHVEMRPAPARA